MNGPAVARAPRPPARLDAVVVTPPLFAIPFGVAGLAGTWRTAGPHWATAVGDVVAVVAAVLTVTLAVPWVVSLVRRPRDLVTQLRDPLAGPSVPALPIAGLLVAASLSDPAGTLGRAFVAVLAVLTLVAGFAVAGAWLVAGLPWHAYQPGFYLPTAGACLLAAQCVTGLRWLAFAQVLFFVGLAAWLVLAVVTGLRLLRTPLPLALRPVLAIEIAAPALAANTYLVVFHRFDDAALALAVVTASMGVLQLGLLPYFRRAPFGPAFWVSSFSYATAATLAVRWIDHELPSGAAWWRAVTLAVATAVIVVLGWATVRSVARGSFLHRRTQPPRPGTASRQ